jgi:hypothetical protein
MLRRCHVGSKFERSPADPLQSGFSLFRKEKRPQEAFRGGPTAGLGAAVAAVPGLAVAGRFVSAEERVAHHTRELERAMRDLYGTKEVSVLIYEPSEDANPLVLIVPKMTDAQRVKYKV